MLAKENFDLEHINMLRMQYKKDPSLLERVIYAFGLLEAIAKVDMPFVFKGGTCLMLLTEHPMRLSTDIDIIVESGTDVDKYIAISSRLMGGLILCKKEDLLRKTGSSLEIRLPIGRNPIWT